MLTFTECTDASQDLSRGLTVRSIPVSSPGNRGSFMMSQAWTLLVLQENNITCFRREGCIGCTDSSGLR